MYGKDKDYVSYSSLRLWKTNKEQYRKRYYEGELDSATVYTLFGKKIAELLERRDFKEYPALRQVPFYSVSEEPMDVEIEGVRIKGFIDLYEPETFTFGEVKSGIISRTNGPPWTAVKVRAHEQLPFYSLLIKKKYGKVQNKCHLIWLETSFNIVSDTVGSRTLEADGKDLQLTGAMKIFPRSIQGWERARIKNEIITLAAEIKKDYETYLKSSQ